LPDNRIFDIDDEYQSYIDNKNNCRRELDKHLCTHEFSYEVEFEACVWIAHELARSYPTYFSIDESESEFSLQNKRTDTTVSWNRERFQRPERFRSLFDALSHQVQEDLAIFRLDRDTGRDWLAAIHLCSPNHWDPREKVGRPFPEIHQPVPAMERTISQYKPMLQSVISKGPFARYAWGIDTDAKLNHHPAGPNRANKMGDRFFVRMERQHLAGLPAVNSFLFTIRTYFVDVDLLGTEERTALAAAIRTMTPASLAYKRMTDLTPALLRKLESVG
jgi:hypothetical protein